MNRRVPVPEHPTKPMEDGAYQSFRRKDDPDCLLSSLYFTVTKDEVTDIDTNATNFMFYAIIGDINATNNPVTPQEPGTEGQKFENQIGLIHCSRGWIENLRVMPSGERPNENPLRCGIGTVLTELCLIDPGVNIGGQDNIGQQTLSEYTQWEMVKHYCGKLVGLTMVAEPRSGGRTYFTAAINMGYVAFLLEPDLFEREFGTGQSAFENPINVFSTRAAKELYDIDTGIIRRGERQASCRAWGGTWYFCGRAS